MNLAFKPGVVSSYWPSRNICLYAQHFLRQLLLIPPGLWKEDKEVTCSGLDLNSPWPSELS